MRSSEVPYALRTLKKWDRPWAQRDYDMGKTMSSYWINFVKTGSPNASGLPEWKKYDSNTGNIMDFNEGAVLRMAMFKEEFRFMDKYEK